ncbi:NAD(P)H-quinone oxidoreductase [Rhodococcus sp. NPDC127528]|uniref:NAD(P)H-quinone oxidoreductase n=1 Tax=unclassified Rhodococcus (in: high G+C Gram-positive bacteria) TaxID=192944 RepID=UPI003629495F
MRGIAFDAPGPPGVLTWREMSRPEPSPTDVVVAVRAAGITHADLLEREGHYPSPGGGPRVPGLECAGTIQRVGERVIGWSEGEQVCALLGGGGYAELAVAPARQLLPIPDGLGFPEAAALPDAACTAYANLTLKAHLRAGQWVLVHGGGSGIGTMAVQWAKASGAHVITTVGSRTKLDRVLRLGADVAVDYRTDDFVARALAATGGRGVDAILDVVGRPYLRENIECLGPDGHLVVIGGTLGPVEVDLGLLFSKRASIAVTSLRSRPPDQKAAVVAAVRRHMWPVIARGVIAPVVDTVLPMPLAAEAHELLYGGRTFGTVVLTVP